MLSALLHLAILAVTILALAKLHPGVRIKTPGTALVVALVFSVLNVALGWLIGFFVKAMLLLPGIFTFGLLFLLVPFFVNVVLLWMTDRMMSSFELRTGRSLLVCAIVITLVNGIVHTRVFQAALHGAAYPGSHWV